MAAGNLAYKTSKFEVVGELQIPRLRAPVPSGNHSSMFGAKEGATQCRYICVFFKRIAALSKHKFCLCMKWCGYEIERVCTSTVFFFTQYCVHDGDPMLWNHVPNKTHCNEEDVVKAHNELLDGYAQVRCMIH